MATRECKTEFDIGRLRELVKGDPKVMRDKTGVTLNQCRSIVGGGAYPSVPTLMRIADGLKRSVGYFFSRKNGTN